MKLALSFVDASRWKGLLEDDKGDIYKVTLFPGSATEPWHAVIESGGWVELEEGKLTEAIREAFQSQIYSAQEDALLKAIQSNPDILEEILKVLRSSQQTEITLVEEEEEYDGP